MKISALTISAFIALASAEAAAKTTYLDGKVDSVDSKTSTVSVIKAKTKELVTFKYDKSAKYETVTGKSAEVAMLKKGQKVRLELKPTK